MCKERFRLVLVVEGADGGKMRGRGATREREGGVWV